MRELREDLDISTVFMGYDAPARGIEAKFRIAEILGIEINSVKRFKDIVKSRG